MPPGASMHGVELGSAARLSRMRDILSNSSSSRWRMGKVEGGLLLRSSWSVVERLGKIDKPKHAKEFFTGATYKRVGGEQLTAKCMYCSVLVTSTGATRLLDHLVKCSLCPSEVRERFAALRNITHSKRKEKQESEALMKEEAERQLCQAKVQKVLVQPGIRGSLKTAEAVNADEAIARFFYVNGISFAAADTAVDSYYKEMCRAIKAAPMGYIP
eukprot:CAMPEP_0113236624 /NCGR_PEP_ID=MMETSP0008_2-20120614/4192_1 /TAXON_ID=97485 /ORGANISM="Prymnesium parvum" /LENGTH=214 /DNA_ID=CAMNT_0000083637 /DNA_START=363 /DNA_END=1003 /DNA_ORIENTATION=- /assembly_acc=CAM_ASM_000153